MSSIVSPRPICMSRPASTSACPPRWVMPTSKLTRVRVDGRSKIRATILPASSCGHSRLGRAREPGGARQHGGDRIGGVFHQAQHGRAREGRVGRAEAARGGSWSGHGGVVPASRSLSSTSERPSAARARSRRGRMEAIPGRAPRVPASTRARPPRPRHRPRRAARWPSRLRAASRRRCPAARRCPRRGSAAPRRAPRSSTARAAARACVADRRLALVGLEEAAAVLAAQPALGDLRGDRAGVGEPLAVGVLEVALDVIHRVEADQVAERERAHRRRARLGDRGVDRRRRDAVGGRVAVGLGHRPHEHAVDQEPGALAHPHRRLAQLPHERLGGVHCGGAGLAPLDELDQAHHCGGVEEVDPEDVGGAGRDRAELGDRQARGVGGDQRPRAQDRVQAGEDRALEIDALADGLDREVARGKVRRRRSWW